MIVDLHTHLWQNPDQLGPQISARLREPSARPGESLDASPQAHAAAMTDVVDVSVVLGFRSKYLSAEIPNSYIAAYVASRPDHLIGFGCVDPMDAAPLKQLEQILALKLSGIAISPACQDFHPTHSRAMRLYERCAELGLPITIHQGTHFAQDAKLEYARPYLLDELARTFPNLRLVISHCGFPWIDETLVLLSKHKNVYADLSFVISHPWRLYNLLVQAHQLDVTDRLLLGSDFPYCAPRRAIEAIYTINRFAQGTALPLVPREKLRAIVERDALWCLGIRRPAAATTLNNPSPRLGGKSKGTPR